MSAATQVRPARPEEYPALADVLVEAFHRDPLARWLFPDAGERNRRHRGFFEATLSAPDTSKRVDTNGELSAVAIWRIVRAPIDADAPSTAPPAAEALFRDIAASGPAPPYLYLAFLGARRSGTGAGGALLRHGCAGATGRIALWTGNARNLPFYERAGFMVSRHVVAGPASAWWLTREP